MVVHYRNQKYSQLKRDYQRRGELFTDPQFPPSNESLFLSGKSEKEIVWKRPHVSGGGGGGGDFLDTKDTSVDAPPCTYHYLSSIQLAYSIKGHVHLVSMGQATTYS